MVKNKKRKYAVILGTRPNFVKAAPFFDEAKKHDDVELILVNTGQHFDKNLSKIFFEQMNIPKPNKNLGVGLIDENIKISATSQAIISYLSKINDISGVIVFGDVMSTLAGAIAAKKLKLKLIHIESGLRSYDKRMPEENNRIIVDNLSDILFVSEVDAISNLKREGISHRNVYFVGNIMIDALERFKESLPTLVFNRYGLKRGKYIIVTIHRAENITDKNTLEKILNIISNINKKIKVIFPIHPNTNKKIKNWGLSAYLKDLIITEPLSYFDFISLVIDSGGVLTDSGGIQEETSHLGIPCATLRDNTERPVTIKMGSNKLFSVNKNYKILTLDIMSHLSKKFKSKHIKYWDKKVSSRIFKYL